MAVQIQVWKTFIQDKTWEAGHIMSFVLYVVVVAKNCVNMRPMTRLMTFFDNCVFFEELWHTKKSYEQGHLSSRNLEAVQSSTKFSLSGKKTVIIGHIYIIFSICHMIGNCEKILSFSSNIRHERQKQKRNLKRFCNQIKLYDMT